MLLPGALLPGALFVLNEWTEPYDVFVLAGLIALKLLRLLLFRGAVVLRLPLRLRLLRGAVVLLFKLYWKILLFAFVILLILLILFVPVFINCLGSELESAFILKGI